MVIIDRIDGNDATPERLWNEFISQRQPVLIQSLPRENGWRANLWTNEYLMRKAGHSTVSVEYRSSDSEGFGLGKRRRMLFKEFLLRLSKGQENLYVTSPEQPVGPYGFPDVMVPPILNLRSDVPLRLSWAGNLVPQQVNMWMGNSVGGASSGLHHDYHDNFYVLLRGRKKFRLFPPSEVKNMYTHGDIVRVYENGRIVYNGQEGIQQDGSHEADVLTWQSSKTAGKYLKQISKMNNVHKSEKKHSMRGDDSNPPSFSRVDLSVDKDSILESFPKFPYDSCIECTVSAGETLYLPAGWFHEVTSMNAGQGKHDGHLAINYWLYPPDNLQVGEQGFRHPYSRGFWNDVWSSSMIRIGEKSKKKEIHRRRKVKKDISKCKLKYGRLWLWHLLRAQQKRSNLVRHDML